MFGNVCTTCKTYYYGPDSAHAAVCAGPPASRLDRFFAGIGDFINGRR